uniref:Uncharacterized protein n=1 Tax=Nicotiana tabacum TaxID=4097 RepID=A0A1S3YUF3_TOBAC|nr:PREDICTED: uncharacterized protein LOC107779781 [Nicotiana tabacum]
MSITAERQTRSYIPEDALIFREEDIKALAQPHDDALVISFLWNNVQIKRVLVDPGSSANVIRSKVVEQLGLLDHIVPTSQILHGFNMESETTKVEVSLPVTMFGTVQDTKFHVIEGDKGYNALLGRPWIHNMREVPSTLHQMLKFLTKDGIKMVYREQCAAKEMFVVNDVAPTSTPPVQDGSGNGLTPEK